MTRLPFCLSVESFEFSQSESWRWDILLYLLASSSNWCCDSYRTYVGSLTAQYNLCFHTIDRARIHTHTFMNSIHVWNCSVWSEYKLCPLNLSFSLSLSQRLFLSRYVTCSLSKINICIRLLSYYYSQRVNFNQAYTNEYGSATRSKAAEEEKKSSE